MKILPTKFNNHIVIIGWDNFAKLITQNLLRAKKKIYIISNQVEDVDFLNENYSNYPLKALHSDYLNFDQVEKSEIEKSSVVLINLKKDTDKLVYIINLKKRFKNLNIVCPIDNSNLKDTFLSAGVTYPLAKEQIAAKMVSSYLFEHNVASYCDDLLVTAEEDTDHDIQQFRVTEVNPFLNLTYDDLFVQMKRRYNAVLLGVSKKFNGGRILLKNPDDDIHIDIEDYMILLVDGKTSKKISKDFGVAEGAL